MQTIVLENKEKTTWELVQKGLSKAVSYEEYRDMVSRLAKEGRSTGPNQTEALTNYTVLNDRRMRRLDKTLKIDEEIVQKIKGFDKETTWLVLTESWCGDAAQTLPMMHKVAALNEKIDLKLILRDEHPELMNRFLTNDAMSIPKLIMVDALTEEVVDEWGPRPSIAQELAADYKKEHGSLTADFKADLQLWYNKDKGQNTLVDLLQLLALE